MHARVIAGLCLVATLGCAEAGADYGEPVPEVIARRPDSGLADYRVPAERMPEGCAPTPVADLDLPDDIRENPFVSTDVGVRREVALLLGLDDELIHSVDSALLSMFQADAALGLYGLELATDWSASETEQRLRERFARTAGDKATIWRSGRLVLVILDQGATQACIDAALDYIETL